MHLSRWIQGLRPWRLARRAIVATLAVLMIGGVLSPPAGALTISEKRALIDREVADVTFFWTMFNNRGSSPYNQFDWSTDLCSWSPDRPLGFDFTRACRRHDFGYRNYKAIGAFNETLRLRVDNAFNSDMKASCATYNVVVRPACYGAAALYYNAVRQFGAS